MEFLEAKENYELVSSESNKTKLKLDFLQKSKSEISNLITKLSGKSETELVESNNTLRLVYSRKEDRNKLGQLVDSFPNEVPLHRNRDIYTLGVEALLCYYGLNSESVSFSENGERCTLKTTMEIV